MLRKLILLLGALACVAVPAKAQIGTISNPAIAILTAQDSGTCSAANGSLVQQLPTNAGSTTVTLAGTFSATVTIRLSNNSGASWTTANTLSAAGTTSYTTAGYSHLCANVTAYTSGAVSVTILTGTGSTTGQIITTVSGLSAYTTKGTVVQVTDGTSATDCTTGGGSTTAVCQYTGSTWTSVGGSGSGAITNQVLNQVSLGGSSASAVSGTVANGLTGQVLQSTNAAAPTFVSPGLPWGNGSAAVTTTPYAVACDSGTAVVDRGSTILFQSGASVINLPDPTAAGCTGNFAVSLYDDGAGTLTVNRGGSSTINVMDGTTNTDGATSFTLATGQTVLCNANAAGTIWACRKLTGGSGIANMIASSSTISSTTPSGTQFLPFMGSQSGLNGTAGQSQLVAPRAGTVSNLQVRVSAAEGASATLKLTLMDGATAEAVTCTIGNSGTTCNDTTHTFAFASGDLLEWQAVQTGTGTAQFVYLTFLIQ